MAIRTIFVSSLALAVAGPVLAQGPAAAADPSAQDAGAIVVTGTRIVRPDLTSPVPVTSITAADLTARGTINIGDALNDLPQLRSTWSQSNSERAIGTSGENFLDLRGLGPQRTLVLVDGLRHITAAPTNPSPANSVVDVNTIPTALLERVDIVTGASSAVYGSDAIAGAVNFVLKQHFAGLQAQGQGSISGRGDHGSYFGSLTWGRNVAEGRGNIAVSGEYARVRALNQVDRDFETGAYGGRHQFTLTTNAALDGPTGSDGIIDNQYFDGGVHTGSLSDGGTLTAVCPGTVAAGTALAGRCRTSRVTGAAANNAERYMFQPDGSLALSQPLIDFRDITNGGNTNTLGGLGSTLTNTGQLDPGIKRYVVNLLSHFDVSDGFKPFVQAKYARIDATMEVQPSFGAYAMSCANPFLTPGALTTLQSIGYCATAAAAFPLTRYNVDLGGRGERDRRQTWRIVGGASGDILGGWHYQVAANYGHFDQLTRSTNNLVTANFARAIAPVLAPSSFTGSNYATNYAGQRVICAVNAASNVDPNCTPISLFGSGNSTITPAARAYVETTSRNWSKAGEFDLTANLGGDLGRWFSLPGGPVRFSIGGEYRRETSNSYWDALAASGGTFLAAIQPFAPPALRISEAYGELDVPLVRDVRFVRELSLNGAGRVSHYSGSTGTVYTWNGGGIYAPTRDFKLRVNWGRAVRAPTQYDLYAPYSQTATVGALQDPCDILYRNGGSPTRAANCTAAGLSPTFVNSAARGSTSLYFSGGNPNLKAETSSSFTVGGVITPRFVPGLAITVDYYNIRVKNRISPLSMQTILNQCYDSATLANQYCALINPRDPATGFFNAASVGNASSVNFAKQTTSGIDIDASWHKALGNGDRVDLRGMFSWTFDKTNYLDPTHPGTPDRQLSELGDPMYEAQASFAYTHKAVTLRYQLHYIGRQTIGTYEAQHSYNGLPPQNADQYPIVWYPAVWYHDIRIGVQVKPHAEFYLGVDNLTDRLPPYGLLATTEQGGIYDNVGRTVYAGFKVRY